MGSAVDTPGIRRQLSQLKDAGFGGVEIVPIYGAKGYEDRYLRYLSPQWMRMLDYTVATANRYGLGVYLAAGTGWPIGGPQVSVQDAATRLIVQSFQWIPGQPFTEKIISREQPAATLSALMAYNDQGQPTDITAQVAADGSLLWNPARPGYYTLYAAFNGKTGQKVKRAAPGGEGFTLDHFSATALTRYLQTFDTAFGKDLHGVEAFYNDSYEVYNADWTPGFFEEFRRRRGYDLKPYLQQFASGQQTDTAAALRNDYRVTMADLMLEHFTRNFTQWAHSKKALSLNQAHGSPGNLLDLYAAVDIPECETFGSSYFPIPGLRRDSADVRNVDPDPNMLKFASSAAHVTGRPRTSCETFTWLGEHFKSSWAQCKPEAEQAFLAGVNHLFFHGTTYSPPAVAWPGWLFYASLNAVPDNSLWPHLPALNAYISRCQSVLQQGSPDNEVAVYWPVYDAWQDARGMDLPLGVHQVDRWLHPTAFYRTIQALQQQGYAVDFLSDHMLREAQAAGKTLLSAGKTPYKVLVVPQCTYLPRQTWQHLLRLAGQGATILLQSTQFREPGLLHLNSAYNAGEQLTFTQQGNLQRATIGSGQVIVAAAIPEALRQLGFTGEALPAAGLQFIRRSFPGSKYYYLVNHSARLVDTLLPLQYAAPYAAILDPQTGRSGRIPAVTGRNHTTLRLRLQPGEALIVHLSRQKPAGTWHYPAAATGTIDLTGNTWQLEFTQGGPALPGTRTIPALQPWTSLQDTTCANFSGTGAYTTRFHLNRLSGTYRLQLDSVYESARIIVNGKPAGILWSIPFSLDITPYLQQGTNTLRIEVANLMANRIRYMDRHKVTWKNYHEINFVNINYKPFDASGWNVMPSGLAGKAYISISPAVHE
jgi:hypothetical protein